MKSLALVSALLLASACGGPVPEEEIGPPRMDVPIAANPEQSGGDSSGLVWSTPESWSERAPSSGMRVMEASTADGMEVVIFHFGEGQGGSVETNFERWQNQMADGSEPEETVYETGDFTVSLIDVRGTLRASPMLGISEPRPDQRLVAAVIEGPGGPWFVRAIGPSRVVESRYAEIRSFIDSISTAEA